jgi:hypothetical protein
MVAVVTSLQVVRSELHLKDIVKVVGRIGVHPMKGGGGGQATRLACVHARMASTAHAFALGW